MGRSGHERTFHAGVCRGMLIAGMAMLAIARGEAVLADPRDERTACWEAYELCAAGAGRAEQWRTTCYSDYAVCMKNPGNIACTDEDKGKCRTMRKDCIARGDDSEVVRYHCRQDYQVCLDSFGC